MEEKNYILKNKPDLGLFSDLPKEETIINRSKNNFIIDNLVKFSYQSTAMLGVIKFFNDINKDSNIYEKQMKLEQFLVNQYSFFIDKNTDISINMDSFPKELRDKIYKYKEEDFPIHYKNLKADFRKKQKKLEKEFPNISWKDTEGVKESALQEYRHHFIFEVLTPKLMFDVIIQTYLRFFSQPASKQYDYLYTCTAFFTELGGNLVNKYMDVLYSREVKLNNYTKSKSQWLLSDEWKEIPLSFTNKNDLSTYKYLLGFYFANSLFATDLLIGRTYTNNKKVSISYLVIPESLENSFQLLSLPFKLPMLVKPKPHGKNLYGGYLSNGVEYNQDLIISKMGYEKTSEIEDDNIIYSTINYLSSCSYKINTKVLDFINEYGEKYGLLVDRKSIDYYQDKIFEKKSLTDREFKEYVAIASKIKMEDLILQLAYLYSKVPSFYFPVRLDQRGRIYTDSTYLTYQGTDLAKSLLLFNEPGYLSRHDKLGIEYFKVYGANCFGLDKKSFESRVEWVDNNIKDIIDYENGILIQQAKDKFSFLSFCIEFSRWENYYHSDEFKPFETYLPIQMDCTCNGFQHLAMLSMESSLFKVLNLSGSTKKSNPEDFYSYITVLLHNYIEEKILSCEVNDEKYNQYKRLLNFQFSRSIIKKVIMVLPYNASNRAMFEYLIEQLFIVPIENIPEGSPLTKKGKPYLWYTAEEGNYTNIINSMDANLAINCISEIISINFQKIDKVREYFRFISKLCGMLGVPIMWNHEKGLKIHQSYLKSKKIRIQPLRFYNQKITLKKFVEILDIDKQCVALMPNVIHSLDASSLTNLINRFKDSYKDTNNFYAIHDCYAVTADKVETLRTLLISVYMSIYVNDTYLTKFHNTVISNICSVRGIKLYEGLDEKNNKISYFLNENNEKILIMPVDYVVGKIEMSKKELVKIERSLYLLG